jgi:hypothetical protein
VLHGRKRVVALTLLALAAPLPAFAISDEAVNSLTTAAAPASISVSTSLDSCGTMDNGIVCKLDVSFNTVPNADSYYATVTRADGSVIDYGAVGAGGASLWVPYVGSGTYSVKITAYGEPDTPEEEAGGRGEVVATGYSNTNREAGDGEGSDRDEAEERDVETGVTGRDPSGQENPAAEGAPTTEVGTATTPEPTCTTPVEPAPAPPTPPEEPPADLDPENPDEDADGIPDEDERVIYEQQLAEYETAIAAQQLAAPATDC